MNLRAIFTKKPVVRPETVKDVKTAVVMVGFSEWIENLKQKSPGATIRVKRSKKFIGEAPAYVGDPIGVSNIDAPTFDRVLYELFGGGNFIIEYWIGSHLVMMKNSKPEVPVTHTVAVEGEPKRIPGHKAAAAESAAQPKTLVGLLLKQFDTTEGIAAVTAFGGLAMSFIQQLMAGKNQSGTMKDMIESVSTLFGMIPSPPDELETLERLHKFQTLFSGNNKPPVNIAGAGSNTFWEGISKVAGQVLGTVIASAQEKSAVPTDPMLQGQESQSPPILAETAAASQLGSASSPSASPSPAASATPQQMFVNAKIMSIQAGMEANLEPFNIANEIWSLLVFIIDNGVVDEDFVQKLYANPDAAFDQIIATYAPQSARYGKLGEVKRLVVEYILEAAEEEVERDPDPGPGMAAQTEKSGDDSIMHVVEFPKREPEEGSQDGGAEIVRDEPVVIGEVKTPEGAVLRKDAEGKFVHVPQVEEEVRISAED